MLRTERSGIETMKVFSYAMIGAFVCGLVATAYGSLNVLMAI